MAAQEGKHASKQEARGNQSSSGCTVASEAVGLDSEDDTAKAHTAVAAAVALLNYTEE